MLLQLLDDAGDPVSGSGPVDVSEDVAQVTITPTVPSTTVTTFAGKFTATDDPEWGTATVGIVVNEDTAENWSDFVGAGPNVEVQIFDRTELTWYRRFLSEVIYNPALAGVTQPGAARTSDFPLPVLSDVTIEEVAESS
jgi:hypothetical protein